MRGYFAKIRCLACVVQVLLLLCISGARSEESPLTVGGYQVGGSVETGWRLTDVDGSRDRYKEVVNLWDGPRLFGLNLWARDPQRSGVLDYFNLNLSGIGDPFPFARLQLKKDKWYDLTATYREYRFSFNREDDGILTDNHDFHQKRRLAGLTVSTFPGEDVRLTFGYSYAGREGDARVPRTLFAGVSEAQDLDERLDQYYVSGDFSVGGWDFHIKQSYWTYRNRGEIDPNPPFFYQEKRHEDVETYVTTFKTHTKLGERWDFDAGYTFAHSEGDSRIFSASPGLTIEGNGSFGFDTHIAETGLSYLLLSNVILHLDYQFHTRDQGGGTNADFLGSPAFDSNFAIRAHTGTFQAEYIPRENLTLRAGYRVQYRDVNANHVVAELIGGSPQEQGGEHLPDSQGWTHGWIGSIDWKPWKVLSLYGEYQGADFSNPYTWISPDSENIAKLRVKYSTPIENLALKGTLAWKRKANPDHDYVVDTRDYTLAATYQPKFAPGLFLDASFTYEQILDKTDIFLAPGISPFGTRFVFDSDAFIYTGSITYEGIYKGLGARFSGSYAQTKGENPQDLADAVLSIWYKNPCVTPVVTLERTYLVDHKRKHDDFDTNMVVFSLRKEF